MQESTMQDFLDYNEDGNKLIQSVEAVQNERSKLIAEQDSE